MFGLSGMAVGRGGTARQPPTMITPITAIAADRPQAPRLQRQQCSRGSTRQSATATTVVASPATRSVTPQATETWTQAPAGKAGVVGAGVRSRKPVRVQQQDRRNRECEPENDQTVA